MSESKRSDFPCPGVIRGGNTERSQTEQTREINDNIEKAHKRGSISKEGSEWLAEKRKNPKLKNPWTPK